ncbi:coiled-coil domain-containing protein 62 isoform X4 [Onychomys torridus]|uniref:coiled-coil domain-containing protein 62 isoform X4 n=1 Tax=Onychomys torridus TaxID=38674 RepID=UPI00167FA45F|nr:coiled-coil domain-containing protein 62 isoform X4 [Onychomys torridus]
MRCREGAASRPAGLPAPVRPGAYGVSGVTRWWHRLSLGTGASPMIPSATFFSRRQNIGSEVENSTIEKQRKELQLLIGELKDRDKELNDMVTVHQRQLLSWEEDRQKVLTLEERCSKLEGELHKRTDIIKSLMKKVKMLESNQIECQAALQKTQQQLQEMAQKATHSALLSEDLEARNENLSSTLVELSAQVGQLQAREQALTTMIKLKDKDIIEAVNHISDCSGKFKLLEHALRDAKMAETCIVKEKQDYKQKLKALRFEISKLKEDLTEKTTENNDQREEIIRLKQEKSCLHDELIFTAEREKRKDELLDIAKSKQDRTNSELHNLRQIYVKQQSDLQFLNFNVENSQELIQIYDSKMEESKALGCSELITIQAPQCLGSSKSAEREDESGASPDKRTSSKSVFLSKDAALSNEKDDFSPTSKLQRLLAESRQMVTDLELSTLLPISCENLNRSRQDSVWKAESGYHTSWKDKGDCDSHISSI